MESRLQVIDVKTGEIKEESQKNMVLTAFRNLGKATDWDIKEWIQRNYQIQIDERNWVSARRGDLISDGLVEATEKHKIGEFGKSCLVWRYNAEGKKLTLACLSSNEMNRAIKKMNEYCLKANEYQRNELRKVIDHYQKMS